jgi:Tfp pilus assembly major pilin PilA
MWQKRRINSLPNVARVHTKTTPPCICALNNAKNQQKINRKKLKKTNKNQHENAKTKISRKMLKRTQQKSGCRT